MHHFAYDHRAIFPDTGLSFCAIPGVTSPLSQVNFKKHLVACPEMIERSVPSRQTDFLLGRLCARFAMQRFVPDYIDEIKIGANREPIFPIGFSGSITHTTGFAAAVCQDESQGTVGLDAECLLNRLQASEIGHRIGNASEFECAGWQELPAHLRCTLIFSAKEAAFKALFPWVKKILDFDSGRVHQVDLETGTLQLVLSNLSPSVLPSVLDVRFRLFDTHVVTFATVNPNEKQPDERKSRHQERNPPPASHLLKV